ncbi:XRE family transcriptional regulator [Streptomyces sp. GQFP]|uniref:XRE family transcriptional regulator n=1 Tax=Streptomyces sp. GQFP TaxID=2907545 RepID=UPI001F327023|nr:XRE family transcriptional regulator [Streptomyces sp. GQFP]UIX34814.1 XRE family transcriptional regulator [Streptomyces sp. GQFP]
MLSGDLHRVNEIINGHCEVSRLVVYERIADGLHMPDGARHLLGLAASCEKRTGGSEFDLVAFVRSSAFRGSASGCCSSTPDSDALTRRAAEIGESAESLVGGVRLTEARLRELLADDCDIQVYRYRMLPTWRLIRMDAAMFVSAFDSGWEGHESVTYEVMETAHGPLFRGFRRMLKALEKAGGELRVRTVHGADGIRTVLTFKGATLVRVPETDGTFLEAETIVDEDAVSAARPSRRRSHR